MGAGAGTNTVGWVVAMEAVDEANVDAGAREDVVVGGVGSTAIGVRSARREVLDGLWLDDRSPLLSMREMTGGAGT